MAEQHNSSDIQEECKRSYLEDKTQNEKLTSPINEQQYSQCNQIKISKGQKNAFVKNFTGIKSVELKQQVQARHFDDAFCLCVLDNIYLAVGSTDATITIYNLQNNCKLIRKINYFSEPILVLEPLRLFHKTLLLSSGYDQIINIWDYQSGKKITDLESCGCEVTKLCDNLDKNLIVGSTFDGRIILWSYVNRRIVNVLKIPSELGRDRSKLMQSLLIEENQQENEDEFDEEILIDSEMDLESHGSIYSLHQICCDSYLVLQRGCISEIKIVKQYEKEHVETQVVYKESSSDLDELETEQTPYKQAQKVVRVTDYSIQIIRQFEANQDAIQFNVIPYEDQKIITLGTKRGWVYLFDFEKGVSQQNKRTHTGAVNEILTIQTLDNKFDNPFIITTSHEDRYFKIESLKSGQAIVVEDDKIFCYNECMNSKMQFFKNKKNELFMVVICQEHQNPYFSIYQIHMNYSEPSSQPPSTSK